MSSFNMLNYRYVKGFLKYFFFADDLPTTSTGEYMNHTLTEDDGGYYNTAEVNTVIRVDDLQRLISEKSAGEKNMFQSEYRVLSLIFNNIKLIFFFLFRHYS